MRPKDQPDRGAGWLGVRKRTCPSQSGQGHSNRVPVRTPGGTERARAIAPDGPQPHIPLPHNCSLIVQVSISFTGFFLSGKYFFTFFTGKYFFFTGCHITCPLLWLNSNKDFRVRVRVRLGGNSQ